MQPAAPQWGVKAQSYVGKARADRNAYHDERCARRLSMGRRASHLGVARVARDERVPRGLVRYWLRKYEEGAAFHGGQWGGYRRG